MRPGVRYGSLATPPRKKPLRLPLFVSKNPVETAQLALENSNCYSCYMSLEELKAEAAGTARG